MSFQNAAENTMVFYTCAICGVEEGINMLKKLHDLIDRIELSGIKEMYESMLKLPCHATKYDIAFRECAMRELDNGLLKGSKYVCLECVKGLPVNDKENARRHAVSDTISPGINLEQEEKDEQTKKHSL